MFKKALLLCFLLSILLFSSCDFQSRKTLVKENLFAIPLGKLADEIDYFQRDNLQFSPDNDLFMKDGFFYISNGRSGKFMKFNSYGDLLTLIYNPDRNPYPAELMSRGSDNSEVNRQVISWQFNSPGSISVSEKDIYIVDKVAFNRQIFEDEVLMDRHILHFNSNGDWEYENFIGLEGIGGQPFPYIEDIWISELSELIVLYRTRRGESESWFVNWYRENGSLRYTVEIRKDAIPLPAGETDLIFSLDNIIPDRSSYEIYLKMSYFRKDENSSKDSTSISEVFGGTLAFDVEESRWHSWSRLPDHKIMIDEMEIDSPYSLIGTVRKHLFFISLGEKGEYNLLIKNEKGYFEREKTLIFDENDIIYYDFFLSGQGILNAIVFTDQEAKIMWWRTDKLLSSVEDNG